MNTCDTCKHWHQFVWRGRVPESRTQEWEHKAIMTALNKEPFDDSDMRPVIHVSNTGSCDKFVSRWDVKKEENGAFPDVISPLDALICDSASPSNQWGSGGVNAPETGPKFGCVRHEPKSAPPEHPSNQVSQTKR